MKRCVASYGRVCFSRTDMRMSEKKRNGGKERESFVLSEPFSRLCTKSVESDACQHRYDSRVHCVD